MARVLVVDEDAQVRATLGLSLAQAGHQVSAACSGLKAANAFRDQPSAVLLGDRRLPLPDGLAAIRDRRPKSSVGKIVALAERESASGQTPLGLAGYLGASRLHFKPVNPEMLVKMVTELVSIATSKPSRQWRW
jgi:DNA-binding response OmpR family regulator